jgi:uncharacterized protein (DUF362 family)
MSKVAKVKFIDYNQSVAKALDLTGAGQKLPKNGLIILKPNLTNSDPPPVTTPVEIVEAVYLYCKSCRPAAEIAIGEGCGKGDTGKVFDSLGYTALSKKYNIRLIDFNKSKPVLLKNPKAFQLKEFFIPEIVLNAYVISIPVLKDHSFTKTTIAMKNMFGLAPSPFYKDTYRGAWNKSKLHSPSTHKSVVDVCTYKKPDLSIVDAVNALCGMHLAGTEKKLGLILASFDPVAVDAVGSELLGHNPQTIEYLKLADGLLGNMNNIKIAT